LTSYQHEIARGLLFLARPVYQAKIAHSIHTCKHRRSKHQ